MRTVSLLAILVVGRLLPAQPTTWAAAITQTVGGERPIDKPDIDARCSGSALDFPDSVALVNARFERPPEVWVRWPNDTKGHWKALPTPARADTFHVRIAGMSCSYSSIILEHDNHFVRVAVPPSSPATARDTSPFYLLAAGAATEPALFGWSCASTCAGMIVTADSLRRLNAESQKYAERAAAERSRAAAAAAAVAKAKADADAAAERTERLKRAAARKAERLREYRALGWSEDDIALVMAGQIRIGFTARQVRESVGSPSRINTTVTAAGTHEQWVYVDELTPSHILCSWRWLERRRTSAM
jgi:hypothetical protein